MKRRGPEPKKTERTDKAYPSQLELAAPCRLGRHVPEAEPGEGNEELSLSRLARRSDRDTASSKEDLPDFSKTLKRRRKREQGEKETSPTYTPTPANPPH